MQLPTDADIPDTDAQRKADKRRWLRAFNVSLAFVGVLTAVFLAQPYFEVARWTVTPGEWAGASGLLAAPLLHGSFEHLAANAIALLMLGTLAGGMYPKATVRGLPLIWIGAGLGAWLLGQPGSHHLGASGLSHGLMFMVFGLGLLRRDRPAVAAAMAAFLFYGGMLLTVLPREPGVSWQAHLGGALGGVAAAWLMRRLDPQPPRKRYSWEDEDGLDPAAESDRSELEPGSPQDVPVIWRRGEPDTTGTVLPFRQRKD